MTKLRLYPLFNLKEFRAEKDEFFGNHPQSPLTREQKHAFKGLKYFPEDPVFRMEVKVEKFPTEENVSIQTTGGNPQTYKRFGHFKFQVEGQNCRFEHGDDQIISPEIPSYLVTRETEVNHVKSR